MKNNFKKEVLLSQYEKEIKYLAMRINTRIIAEKMHLKT